MIRPGQRIVSIPEEMSFRALNTRGAAVAGWWMASGVTPLAAYQAKGAASYAASLVNLQTPGTFDLVEGNGAVTWDAVNSWQFVAADAKYFNTGIIPVTNPQTWSAFIQYDTVAITNSALFGKLQVGNNSIFRVNPRQATNQVIYSNGGSLTIAGALLTGNLGFSGNVAYRNGVAEAGVIAVNATVSNIAIFVGAIDNAGVATGFTTANIRAFIVFNTTLTAPQVTLLTAAMAAL